MLKVHYWFKTYGGVKWWIKTVTACRVVEFIWMGLIPTKLLHLVFMIVLGRDTQVMTNSIKHILTFRAKF